MGQKVYPTGFRRRILEKRLARAAVSRVEIERAGDKVKVIILTARPGVVIGKKGSEIEGIRPELETALVAQSIAEQLEGRVAFRRAMRKAVQSARKSVAKGVRIQCSISGVSEEIAREALRLAQHKLPIKTKIVTRATQDGEDK